MSKATIEVWPRHQNVFLNTNDDLYRIAAIYSILVDVTQWAKTKIKVRQKAILKHIEKLEMQINSLYEELQILNNIDEFEIKTSDTM